MFRVAFNGTEHSLALDVQEIGRIVAEVRRQIAAESPACAASAPALPPGAKTFGELAMDWVERIAKRRVRPYAERRTASFLEPLFGLHEGDITAARIDSLFASLLQPEGTLAPSSVNRVRNAGRMIVRDAQANRLWSGPNPFELVRRMKQKQRSYITLTIADARLFVNYLKETRHARRHLWKTMVVLGLRPGEAYALRREDVDLRERMIHIRRSHGRDSTKTGTERRFPLPDCLVETMREAMAESECEYVFPASDRRTREREAYNMSPRLRSALGAAGVVTGYKHKCRRIGCGFAQVRDSAEALPCPRCYFRLWPVPMPKHIRFYDLRHSACTLHLEAGAQHRVVQLMLGHSAGNTTDSTYTHFTVDFCREQLNKLQL